MYREALALICSILAATPLALADPLDLDDPEDAVRAMRKIMCHLEDGVPAVFWWEGSVYSRVPGEKDRRLFDYQGMNIRACVTREDPEAGYGYRQVSREVLVYTDPATGEIARTWTNPWTGEEVEVVHIANDPVNFGPISARGRRGPFRLGATFVGDKGVLAIEVPLYYRNPLGGDYQEYVGGNYQAIEMFGFFFDRGRLLDPEVGGLEDTFVSWARVVQWLPWMKMGDRPGQIMYHGVGKRIPGFEDLPALLKDEIRRSYPAFTEPPPLDDTRPNETSWIYLKKRLDAARAPGKD